MSQLPMFVALECGRCQYRDFYRGPLESAPTKCPTDCGASLVQTQAVWVGDAKRALAVAHSQGHAEGYRCGTAAPTPSQEPADARD